MKTYVGIDNGVTGSLGVIYPNGKWGFKKTPVKKELNYTKDKANITRIDHEELYKLLSKAKQKSEGNILILLERPMVNPKRWVATQSALRAIEATLVIIESLRLPHQYIDSKEWQKELLPRKLKKKKGSKETDKKDLKLASISVGKRLFPGSERKADDCDGILIAEHGRRKKL